MKRLTVTLLTMSLAVAGCGKRDSAPTPPATNQPASGNPITAPVDYLGAIGQAQKQAAKVVDLAQVQQAIQQFRAAEDRYPKELGELVKEGYLAKIPSLPAGMNYQYNPATGQIRAVPAR